MPKSLTYQNRCDCLRSAECAGGAAASAAPVAAAARSGEEVYNSACAASPQIGVAGAPKGDSAAWKPRMAQGESTVLSHTINGLNAMPSKGTCANCSDDELLAAYPFYGW